MTQLSPAAQAVLDAWSKDENGVYLEGDPERLAYALRAVADQVVPETPKPSGNSDWDLHHCIGKPSTLVFKRYYQRKNTRIQILAIATELEAL